MARKTTAPGNGTGRVNGHLTSLLVPLASLREDATNARTHSKRNIEAISYSLRRFGQQKPLVVLKDGVVIAGNGTLRAAQSLGWTQIAAVTFDSTEDARAYALADNRTADLSEWDARQLAAVAPSGLLDGLWDDGELAQILDEAASESLVAGDLDRDAVGFSDEDREQRAYAVKVVIHSDEIAEVEAALAATGEQNRATALLTICRAYTAKGQ